MSELIKLIRIEQLTMLLDLNFETESNSDKKISQLLP